MKQDIEKVLLSEETIAAKVKELGAQIAKDYADKNPLIVSVLRGSFVFMADLVRAIHAHREHQRSAASVRAPSILCRFPAMAAARHLPVK